MMMISAAAVRSSTSDKGAVRRIVQSSAACCHDHHHHINWRLVSLRTDTVLVAASGCRGVLFVPPATTEEEERD